MFRVWKAVFSQNPGEKVCLSQLRHKDILQAKKGDIQDKGSIMVKINKETQERIQELQILEQNLQQIVLQKQAFQMELNETESALSELEKTKDEVYRIVGSIMIKTQKAELEKELKEKKEILSLRLKSIEKQESSLMEKTEKEREELMKSVDKP